MSVRGVCVVEPRNALERHIQTIILALLIGLVGWVGVSVTDGREADARQEVQLINLADQVKELRKAVAVMNVGVIEARLNEHERRIITLEKEK